MLVVINCAPLPIADAASQAPVHPLLAKLGETITLQGSYQGWGQCELSSGATRSDWVLAYRQDNAPDTAAQCVFVSGVLPLGIVPAPSTTSVGMPVVVKGKVARSATGKPYLAAE